MVDKINPRILENEILLVHIACQTTDNITGEKMFSDWANSLQREMRLLARSFEE